MKYLTKLRRTCELDLSIIERMNQCVLARNNEIVVNVLIFAEVNPHLSIGELVRELVRGLGIQISLLGIEIPQK